MGLYGVISWILIERRTPHVGSQDIGQILVRWYGEKAKCKSFQKSFRRTRHFLAEASSWSVSETHPCPTGLT